MRRVSVALPLRESKGTELQTLRKAPQLPPPLACCDVADSMTVARLERER